MTIFKRMLSMPVVTGCLVITAVCLTTFLVKFARSALQRVPSVATTARDNAKVEGTVAVEGEVRSTPEDTFLANDAEALQRFAEEEIGRLDALHEVLELTGDLGDARNRKNTENNETPHVSRHGGQ